MPNDANRKAALSENSLKARSIVILHCYAALREQNQDKETRLAAIQGDLHKLKEIRAWADKVIPGLLPDLAEQKKERSSVLAKLQDASPQPGTTLSAKQKTQDMEH